MPTETYDTIRAVQWLDGSVRLLDQRFLPQRHEYIECKDAASVAQAISAMIVRGAPAIGISAAYGVVLAATQRYLTAPATWQQDIETDLALLAASRPTAINLTWALHRMRHIISEVEGAPLAVLLAEAKRIHEQDLADNRSMGKYGADLMATGGGVLTHCNTGSLATGGYGTALGVIRTAYAQGKIEHVFAAETRPWLQGARLTAWELLKDGIPVTLITDSAAAHLMRQGQLKWVIVGADRIAANGDTANKIGTYSLAVLARHHGLKFMVVAPSFTVDMTLSSGADIPIEMRSPQEILAHGGQDVAAAGAGAWNPAFDVTPAGLIDVLVTEKGIVFQPTVEKIALLMQSSK
ncbi:MAG: S-methyl-5-thioribose-1-phosphate isomerase [Gammaproteobacteria bacterium]